MYNRSIIFVVTLCVITLLTCINYLLAMRRKLFELKVANEDDTDSTEAKMINILTEVPDNRGKPHLYNKNDSHSNERFFMTRIIWL